MELVLCSCSSAPEHSTQTSCFMYTVVKEFLRNRVMFLWSATSYWDGTVFAAFREPEPTPFKGHFNEIILSVIYQPLCEIFLPFHTVYGVLKARIQTSPPWPICLEWPHMAWLSFFELDKAVVHVIRLASFLWSWILLPSKKIRNKNR